MKDSILFDQLKTEYPEMNSMFLHYVSVMLDLHRKKAKDYGPVDTGNLVASEDFGIPAHVGITLRMSDKMKRIQQFIKSGNLVNESFEDSLLDMANYSLLCLVLYQKHKNKEALK